MKPYAELRDNKRKVILSHYPMICYNGQYRRDEEGRPRSYMLYGHVHDTFDEALVNRYQEETRRAERPACHGGPPLSVPCQMINCFCMFSDYIPLTLDEWIETDGKRRSGRTDEISFRTEGTEKSENAFDKFRKDSTKFYTPHCITGRNPVNCEYGYNRDSTEAGEDKM